MATTLTVNGSVTLDESAGLQNSGTAAGSEDNNDNDVSLATLQANALAFYNRLFNTVANGGLNLATTFPTANGVAQSASNFVTVSSGGSVVDLGFVNGSGGAIPVYAAGVTGTATGLTTLAGDAISLFLDPSLGNDMVLGVVTHGTATTADDTIAFALYLQPTNGTNTAARVWITQFTPISNPSATNPDDPVTLFDSIGVSASVSTEFNFNALPSGQNLFGVVGGTDTALVVIGGHPLLKSDGTFTNASDTINTSQGGGAVTIGVNNQMFDAGESAFFTFVKTPNPSYLSGVANGLDQNEADDADNIQYTGGTVEANGGFLKVVRIQGGGLAALDIAASNIFGGAAGDRVRVGARQRIGSRHHGGSRLQFERDLARKDIGQRRWRDERHRHYHHQRRRCARRGRGRRLQDRVGHQLQFRPGQGHRHRGQVRHRRLRNQPAERPKRRHWRADAVRRRRTDRFRVA